MTTLVVFDIDGTLLRSADEHHAIITTVLARSGLDVLAKPWGEYKHYTDSSVIDEVIRDTHGRGVTSAELVRFDHEYLAELELYLAGTPVTEIPGARRLLASLEAHPDTEIAFATGSLRSMAVRKLSLLGIDASRVALSTGSEHRTREEIVLGAIGGRQADVVSLGDGAWDERTALALGIPFVGVQSGGTQFGAVPVVGDLTGLTAADLVKLAGVRQWH